MTGRAALLLTIVRTDLVRLGRDRVALFFIAVLPFIVIIALGSFVTDSDAEVRLAVVDLDRSAGAKALREQLGSQAGVVLRQMDEERQARRDLQLDLVNGVVVIPDGYGERLASGQAEVTLVVDRARASATLVTGAVGAAVDRLGRQLSVSTLLAERGLADATSRVARAEAEFRSSEVTVDLLGTEQQGGSTLTFVAGGQLLLFMFVNSLAAGAALIEMRRLGVARRLLSGPVDVGDLVTGVALARLLVAGLFGAVVATLSVLVWGVDWGSIAVLAAVITLFALISAGAATLIGAVLDEPDAATSVGIPLGLAMAALGGCMFPIWLAPDVIQLLSKVVTPHAWALDALLSAAFDGAGPADLWQNLLVLSSWAAVLVVAGRLLARRRLRTA